MQQNSYYPSNFAKHPSFLIKKQPLKICLICVTNADMFGFLLVRILEILWILPPKNVNISILMGPSSEMQRKHHLIRQKFTETALPGWKFVDTWTQKFEINCDKISNHVFTFCFNYLCHFGVSTVAIVCTIIQFL